MALVSVTRLHLKSSRHLPVFLWYSLWSLWQARRAPGNLQAIIRRQANNHFWTLTVWDSEAAMRAYMTSGAHREVMPKIVQWCDDATSLHWLQDGAELPTWAEAEQRMQREGKPFKLLHRAAQHPAKV